MVACVICRSTKSDDEPTKICRRGDVGPEIKNVQVTRYK